METPFLRALGVISRTQATLFIILVCLLATGTLLTVEHHEWWALFDWAAQFVALSILSRWMFPIRDTTRLRFQATVVCISGGAAVASSLLAVGLLLTSPVPWVWVMALCELLISLVATWCALGQRRELMSILTAQQET